jgi:hypothetical protein
MKRVILLILGVSIPGAGPAGEKPATKPIPELNQKVLAFAKEHLGKQVGNGECWTLAADALGAAGAHRPASDGYSSTTFGRKLTAKEKILPGDVVQFEKAKFVHNVRGNSSWEIFPHHTAIVARARGLDVTLIHQNYRGRRTVHQMELNLADRTEGTVDVYRPQPATGSD